MKNFLLVAAAFMAITPAFAVEVGALGGLGDPGYGQIDIHRYSKPRLVYTDPVVIREVDVGVPGAPVYLYVPPEHAKDWRRHCQKYNACEQRVYFVEDNWYNKVYVPEYRNRRGVTVGNAKGRGRDKD